DENRKGEVLVSEGVVDTETIAGGLITYYFSVIGRIYCPIIILVNIPELTWIPSLQNIATEKFIFSPHPSCHFIIINSAYGFSPKPAVAYIIVILSSIQLGDFIPV